jgi:hypothetical protein
VAGISNRGANKAKSFFFRRMAITATESLGVAAVIEGKLIHCKDNIAKIAEQLQREQTLLIQLELELQETATRALQTIIMALKGDNSSAAGVPTGAAVDCNVPPGEQVELDNRQMLYLNGRQYLACPIVIVDGHTSATPPPPPPPAATTTPITPTTTTTTNTPPHTASSSDDEALSSYLASSPSSMAHPPSNLSLIALEDDLDSAQLIRLPNEGNSHRLIGQFGYDCHPRSNWSQNEFINTPEPCVATSPGGVNEAEGDSIAAEETFPPEAEAAMSALLAVAEVAAVALPVEVVIENNVIHSLAVAREVEGMRTRGAAGYSCLICLEAFKAKRLQRKPKSYKHKSTLDSHKREHHPKVPHLISYCTEPRCQFKIKTPKSKEAHMRKKHNQLFCVFCDIRYRQTERAQLKKHRSICPERLKWSKDKRKERKKQKPCRKPTNR